MPGIDGTGPKGSGQMTGRGMGYCGRDNRDRFYHPASGFRDVYRLGHRGRRHGPRVPFFATGVPRWVLPTAWQEIADLNAWAERLITQVDGISKCFEEFKA